jgi:ubiquinol-cytochrome c reductase cytochrome c subunit
LSWIIARRRRPVAGYAALLLGLVVVAAVYGLITGTGSAQASQAGQQDLAAGKNLYSTNCSSCHGDYGQGHPGVGPALIGVGAAAVDFQLSTGRMPLKEPDSQPPRKPNIFTDQETAQIVQYVTSFGGGGPAIPDAQQVSTAGADPGLGQELYSTNCAQCHGFAGAGGALTYGKYAPPLTQASATQIYEAMLTGPAAMPVFGNGTIPPQAKRDIIAFVTQTRTEPNPGGFSLGRSGPVTEGLVAWLGGLGVLVLGAMWLTAKRRDRNEQTSQEDHSA